DPSNETPAEERVDADYAAGKAAILAKDWHAAIRSLSSAALRDTRNADIQNYLGYAYRQTGQLELALTHYQRALQPHPRNRAAHEGEVARRPRHPERYPEHIRRQPRRPPCAEPFERARSNERALERETQVARLRGRQNGPLGARQASSDTQVTGTNPSSMGPL